jgi:hypothetical protein
LSSILLKWGYCLVKGLGGGGLHNMAALGINPTTHKNEKNVAG